MGWTFCQITEKSEIREAILRDNTFNRDGREGRVLLHRTVGNHLWMACESTRPGALGDTETVRFVVLALLAKQDGMWGYKDMDESMGPYEADCPMAIIEAAGPTDNKYATEWRAKVAAYHDAARTRRELAKAVKVGSIVVLKDSKPNTFRVASLKPLLGYAVEGGAGRPYKLPQSRIIEVRND